MKAHEARTMIEEYRNKLEEIRHAVGELDDQLDDAECSIDENPRDTETCMSELASDPSLTQLIELTAQLNQIQ